MKRALRRALGVVGALALTGLGACGPQRVPLDIRFPSTETFLVARTMRIHIYARDATTSCASVVNAVSNGRAPDATPIYETDETSSCAVRTGLALPDPGAGPHLYLVEGLDRTGNATILAGCVQAEVYGGSRVEISVYPTSAYQAAYAADTPEAGEDIDSRCGGGGV